MKDNILIYCWKGYANSIKQVVFPYHNIALKDISFLRNDIFCSLLIFCAPLSLIALVPGIYMSFTSGLPVVGFVDIAVFVLLLLVMYYRNLAIHLRKFLLISIFYFISIVLIYYLSTTGIALLFLLSITILISIIYSSKAAFYSAWANTIICIVFGIMVHLKVDFPMITDFNLGTWVAISSNLVLLSFVCVICINLLVKGLEESLNAKKLSEANLVAIVENSDAFIYSIDKELRYITFNQPLKKSVKQNFNINIKPGDKVLDFFEKSEAEVLETSYRAALKGKMLKFEKNFMVGGEKITTAFSINPIFENKVIIGLSCFANDITEQKKVKEKLEQSERKYRELFENNPMPMWIIDRISFQFLDVNEAAIKHYGYSRYEFLKMTATDIRPEAEKKGFIDSKHGQNKEHTKLGVWKHLKKNGAVINAEIVVSEITFDGKQVSLILANDVTEKLEIYEKIAKSEHLYKTIASSIPHAVICQLDTNLKYLLIEGDILQQLGFDKNNMLGHTLEEILEPEIYKSVKKQMDKVLEGEIQTRESVNNGYDIISRFVPLKDENNNVYSIMTVAMDVTELKNAQRAVEDLNQGLEQKVIDRTAQLDVANKELDSFTYSVSHDLQAPLRSINGFTQIVLNNYTDQLDSEAKRLMEIVMSSATKMGQLIADLLSFSRIGKQHLQKQKLDMSLLAKSIYNLLTEQNKSIKITLSLDTLIPAYADSGMLKQVFINLIDNAIKYSGNNQKPTIEIGSYKEDKMLVYFVKDNGAGFDMKYYDKLFGVFQRLHSAKDFEGTGVGLSIVNRIITKHDGKVWAIGEVNRGATFFFSLPEHEL